MLVNGYAGRIVDDQLDELEDTRNHENEREGDDPEKKRRQDLGDKITREFPSLHDAGMLSGGCFFVKSLA